MLDTNLKQKFREHLTDEEIEILVEVHSRKEVADYFFSHKGELKWFYPLKELGYFKADNAPTLEIVDDKGSYRMVPWNILNYLEKASEHIKQPGNERFIDAFIDIIRNVSSRAKDDENLLKNQNIWWFFVKILINIPNEKIPLDIVKLAGFWIDTDQRVSLTGTEIITRLLPKFLPDTPTKDDIHKAEAIFDAVTSLKWGTKIRISGSEYEPSTLIEPFWLMEVFIGKDIGFRVGKHCTDSILFLIADRLKDILRKAHPEHWADIEAHDKEYRLTATHIESQIYRCSIGKYDDTESKSEDDLLRAFRESPKELFNFELTDCKSKDKFVSQIKSNLSQHGFFASVEAKLDVQLADLFDSIFTDYSYIWYRSLADGTGLKHSDVKDSLVAIFCSMLLGKVKTERNAFQRIRERFKEDYTYPLFTRLLLYAIGECWKELGGEFWKMLESPMGEFLFESPHYQPEVYTLLEKNTSHFTIDEKRRIKEIISKGPQKYLPDENLKTHIAYWKQKWYSALKVDPEFAKLHSQQRDITDIDEKIEFREERVLHGPGPSPLTNEGLLQKSNSELVEFLRTFKTQDEWEGPSVEGLGQHLREVVKRNPTRFTDDLSPFLHTDYYYVSDILWGLREVWNDKKDIGWLKTLTFLKEYIARDDFWEDRLCQNISSHFRYDHLSLVKEAAELIQEGTKSDDWAFDEDYLPLAKDILLCIVDRLQVEKDEGYDNVLSHALNSPTGRVIIAFINYALREARVKYKADKTNQPKWSSDLKAIFDTFLSKEITDAYTLFGQYLPCFMYLDSEWTKQKINVFLGLETQPFWYAFMHGYVFSNHVYNDIYKLMRGHYERAIEQNLSRETVDESLVQHIAVGYLRDLELLSDDSLLGMLISGWRVDPVTQLLSFFWHQKEYLAPEKVEELSPEQIVQNEHIKIKIIEFWKYIYQELRDKSLTSNDKSVLSECSKLAVFLTEIDNNNYDWLLLSAKSFGNEPDIDYSFFIEYLDRLKDKGSDFVFVGHCIAKLFLEMLSTFTPDYDSKHIMSIVEHLYQIGDADLKLTANEICEIYLGRNYLFLRDIYSKYA